MSRAVDALRRCAVERWRELSTCVDASDPDHADLVRLAWQDATGIRRVASLIEAGDIEAAQDALDALDTSPREFAFEALDAAGALEC